MKKRQKVICLLLKIVILFQSYKISQNYFVTFILVVKIKNSML